MQQDNLNNMNNVTVKDHLAHQAQLQTFNSLNKVWNPTVGFFIQNSFLNSKNRAPGETRDSECKEINFLVLSLLYLTHPGIHTRDKHLHVTFFYKKSPLKFSARSLCA